MSFRAALILTIYIIASFTIHCKTDSKDRLDSPAEVKQLTEAKTETKVDTKPVYEQFDDTKALTLEQYKKLLPQYTRTTFCETVYTCPEKQMPLAISEVAQFTNKSDCFTNYSGWGNNDIEAKYEATQTGRLTFDAERAKACLQSIKMLASTCDRIHETPTFGLVDCDDVHIPQQKEGEPCNDLDECVIDTYCEQDAPGTPGVCISHDGRNRIKFEEESCEHDPCANGLICDVKPGEEWLTCMKFRPLNAEEPCGLNPFACATGLTCSPSTNQCKPLKALASSGEPCDTDTAGCNLGLTCRDYVEDDQEHTMVGICGAPKPQNEPCHLTSECKADLFCDESRCVTRS